jgi:hypothetical protein
LTPRGAGKVLDILRKILARLLLLTSVQRWIYAIT